MGRPVSTTLADIFDFGEWKVDWTLDLTFPDATSFAFATSNLTVDMVNYANDLQRVGDLRNSIESPVDRVNIGLQNVDRVLGQHIAAYWQKWRRADARLGRLYRGGSGLSLTQWTTMFKGAVQQPNANDLEVFFDLIPDTTSAGQIVASLTLDPRCEFVFKDPDTCAFAGIETACNHFLRSKLGCDGLGNSQHYGGMEHRYPPETSAPGSGGNTGSGFPQYPCPRLDQFVRVRGEGDVPVPKMVCFFDETDELWNPITRRFHRTKWCRVVRGQKIWELIAASGAVGFSSDRHPIIADVEDSVGTPVWQMIAGDPVLTDIYDSLTPSSAIYAANTGETGDVMEIEMVDGKIYEYSDNGEKWIVCHNAKPVLID